MTNEALDTLFLPFETGALAPAGPALFLGAAAHPALRDFKDMDVWQPFYPLAQGLGHLGLNILEEVPTGEKTYKLVLVHVPKQVEEARGCLALALHLLSPDGVLVAAAANDAGGNRLKKWLSDWGLPPQTLSKNKAKVVWGVRPPTLVPDVQLALKQVGTRVVPMEGGLELTSQPGLFGWNKIDAGSRLLAAQIPKDLKGNGADFGAGIGYLSHEVLTRCGGVENFYVLEADTRALVCAKINLENVRADRAITFQAADLTMIQKNLPPLDFIVMNPPFHEGKRTDSSIGQDFIRTAAQHLKKGGRLLMVANAHLPYEKTLEEYFSKTIKLAEKDGFKVMSCVK